MPLARLTARTPGPPAADRHAQQVRAVLPEYADRIVTDPAWPALATTLNDAHKAGLDPTKLLTNERDRRELDSTDSPAATVLWSIRDQAATRINARAGAAASRSTHTKRVAFSDVARSAGFTPPASDASRSQRRR